TVRVSTPFVANPSSSTTSLVTMPRVGLRPTRPLHEAGTRIDPPPSAPWAMGAMPAATAAPAPLDDPPGLRCGSHGLRVIPKAALSVKDTAPNSDVVVFPNGRNPASTRRCTIGADAVAGTRAVAAEP